MKNKKNEPLFARYATQTIDQLCDNLATSVEKGLSAQEVHKRQKEVGLNQIEKHTVSWLTILIRQFNSPFVYVFFIIVAIYCLLGQFTDAIIIVTIIFVNAILGFYQEYHAENSLQMLKQYLISSTLVRRENKEDSIPNNLLVPGDILILYPGDIIPADCRLVQEENLMIDESTLTGESNPVHKTAEPQKESPKNPFDAHNIGFAGTTVSAGKAIAIVFATGTHTELGTIAYLTTQTMIESNLNKATMRLARFLFSLILITLIITMALNIIIKGSTLAINDLFVFSIALAITVIPEALPMVITFCLAKGASRLAQQKVIVKRLSAIEDLGGMEVLCTDKTGTLTENTIAVADVFSDNPRDTLFYAANMLPQQDNHPRKQVKGFESALWQSLTPEELKKSDALKRIKEVPFDPKIRKNIALLQSGTTYILTIRGAIEEIVRYSVLTKDQLASLEQWVKDEEETKGNRVLAMAKKEFPTTTKLSDNLMDELVDLEFLGLIAFSDPIKKTASAAIKKAQELGLQLKVLSGDSPYVCATVAMALGLIDAPDKVITGAEFEKKSDKERFECAYSYTVFARVTPEQKYEIINYLQKKYSVGYLGDGINDAPALKVANVSLVVQDAVPIARETADIILLKKSLMVIVSGVQEGRKIFINTLKYISITVVTTFSNGLSLAIASLFLNYLPMLPFQLLATNLISDFPMIAIATDNVDMQELQRVKKYNVKNVLLIAFILGGITSSYDFVIFSLFRSSPPALLQTSWFIFSVITVLVFIFSFRKKNLFCLPSFPSLPLITFACIASITSICLPFTRFGQKVLQLIPLSMSTFGILSAVIAAYFVTTEIAKLLYYYVASKYTAK